VTLFRWASLIGGTGYLSLTLYLVFGLKMLCPTNVVATNSPQNLGILLGYATVFAGIWFSAPQNPFVKIAFEVGAVFMFLFLMAIVVVFSALLKLSDGTLRPFGC
jgi:hypothetical protein